METMADKGVLDALNGVEKDQISRVQVHIRKYLEGPQCELVSGIRAGLEDVLELANARAWEPQLMAEFTELMLVFSVRTCARFSEQVARMASAPTPSHEAQSATAHRFFGSHSRHAMEAPSEPGEREWDGLVTLFGLLYRLASCRALKTQRFAQLCASHALPSAVVHFLLQLHRRAKPARTMHTRASRSSSSADRQAGGHGAAEATLPSPPFGSTAFRTSSAANNGGVAIEEPELLQLDLTGSSGSPPRHAQSALPHVPSQSELVSVSLTSPSGSDQLEDVDISRGTNDTTHSSSSAPMHPRSVSHARSRLPPARSAASASNASALTPALSSPPSMRPTSSLVNMAQVVESLDSLSARTDGDDELDFAEEEVYENGDSASPESAITSATRQEPAMRLRSRLEAEAFEILAFLCKYPQCVQELLAQDALKPLLLLLAQPHASSPSFRALLSNFFTILCSTDAAAVLGYVDRSLLLNKLLQACQPILRKRDKLTLDHQQAAAAAAAAVAARTGSTGTKQRGWAGRDESSFAAATAVLPLPFLRRLRSLLCDLLSLTIYCIRTSAAVDGMLCSSLLGQFERAAGYESCARVLDQFPLCASATNTTASSPSTKASSAISAAAAATSVPSSHHSEHVLLDKLCSQIEHLVFMGTHDLLPSKSSAHSHALTTPSPSRKQSMASHHSAASPLPPPSLGHAHTASPVAPRTAGPQNLMLRIPGSAATTSTGAAVIPHHAHLSPSGSSVHVRNARAFGIFHRVLLNQDQGHIGEGQGQGGGAVGSASSSSPMVRRRVLQALHSIFFSHPLNAQSMSDHDMDCSLLTLSLLSRSPDFESDPLLAREAWRVLEVLLAPVVLSSLERVLATGQFSVQQINTILRRQQLNLLQRLAQSVGGNFASYAGVQTRHAVYRFLRGLLTGNDSEAEHNGATAGGSGGGGGGAASDPLSSASTPASSSSSFSSSSAPSSSALDGVLLRHRQDLFRASGVLECVVNHVITIFRDVQAHRARNGAAGAEEEEEEQEEEDAAGDGALDRSMGDSSEPASTTVSRNVSPALRGLDGGLLSFAPPVLPASGTFSPHDVGSSSPDIAAAAPPSSDPLALHGSIVAPLFSALYMLLLNHVENQVFVERTFASAAAAVEAETAESSWETKRQTHGWGSSSPIASDPTAPPSHTARVLFFLLRSGPPLRECRAAILRVVALCTKSFYLLEAVRGTDSSASARNDPSPLAPHAQMLPTLVRFVQKVPVWDVELLLLGLVTMRQLCTPLSFVPVTTASASAAAAAGSAGGSGAGGSLGSCAVFSSIQSDMRHAGGFEALLGIVQRAHDIMQAQTAHFAELAAVSGGSGQGQGTASAIVEEQDGSGHGAGKRRAPKRLGSTQAGGVVSPPGSSPSSAPFPSPSSTPAPLPILLLIRHALLTLGSLLCHHARNRALWADFADGAPSSGDSDDDDLPRRVGGGGFSALDRALHASKLLSPKAAPLVAAWMAWVACEGSMDDMEQQRGGSGAVGLVGTDGAGVAGVTPLLPFVAPPHALDFTRTPLPVVGSSSFSSPHALLPALRLLGRCAPPAQRRLLEWLLDSVRSDVGNARALGEAGGVGVMEETFREMLVEEEEEEEQEETGEGDGNGKAGQGQWPKLGTTGAGAAVKALSPPGVVSPHTGSLLSPLPFPSPSSSSLPSSLLRQTLFDLLGELLPFERDREALERIVALVESPVATTDTTTNNSNNSKAEGAEARAADCDEKMGVAKGSSAGARGGDGVSDEEEGGDGLGDLDASAFSPVVPLHLPLLRRLIDLLRAEGEGSSGAGWPFLELHVFAPRTMPQQQQQMIMIQQQQQLQQQQQVTQRRESFSMSRKSSSATNFSPPGVGAAAPPRSLMIRDLSAIPLLDPRLRSHAFLEFPSLQPAPPMIAAAGGGGHARSRTEVSLPAASASPSFPPPSGWTYACWLWLDELPEQDALLSPPSSSTPSSSSSGAAGASLSGPLYRLLSVSASDNSTALFIALHNGCIVVQTCPSAPASAHPAPPLTSGYHRFAKPVLPARTWIHLCLTHDSRRDQWFAGGGILGLYVNGVAMERVKLAYPAQAKSGATISACIGHPAHLGHSTPRSQGQGSIDTQSRVGADTSFIRCKYRLASVLFAVGALGDEAVREMHDAHAVSPMVAQRMRAVGPAPAEVMEAHAPDAPVVAAEQDSSSTESHAADGFTVHNYYVRMASASFHALDRVLRMQLGSGSDASASHKVAAVPEPAGHHHAAGVGTAVDTAAAAEANALIVYNPPPMPVWGSSIPPHIVPPAQVLFYLAAGPFDMRPSGVAFSAALDSPPVVAHLPNLARFVPHSSLAVPDALVRGHVQSLMPRLLQDSLRDVGILHRVCLMYSRCAGAMPTPSAQRAGKMCLQLLCLLLRNNPRNLYEFERTQCFELLGHALILRVRREADAPPGGRFTRWVDRPMLELFFALLGLGDAGLTGCIASGVGFRVLLCEGVLTMLHLLDEHAEEEVEYAAEPHSHHAHPSPPPPAAAPLAAFVISVLIRSIARNPSASCRFESLSRMREASFVLRVLERLNLDKDPSQRHAAALLRGEMELLPRIVRGYLVHFISVILSIDLNLGEVQRVAEFVGKISGSAPRDEEGGQQGQAQGQQDEEQEDGDELAVAEDAPAQQQQQQPDAEADAEAEPSKSSESRAHDEEEDGEAKDGDAQDDPSSAASVAAEDEATEKSEADVPEEHAEALESHSEHEYEQDHEHEHEHQQQVQDQAALLKQRLHQLSMYRSEVRIALLEMLLNLVLHASNPLAPVAGPTSSTSSAAAAAPSHSRAPSSRLGTQSLYVLVQVLAPSWFLATLHDLRKLVDALHEFFMRDHHQAHLEDGGSDARQAAEEEWASTALPHSYVHSALLLLQLLGVLMARFPPFVDLFRKQKGFEGLRALWEPEGAWGRTAGQQQQEEPEEEDADADDAQGAAGPSASSRSSSPVASLDSMVPSFFTALLAHNRHVRNLLCHWLLGLDCTEYSMEQSASGGAEIMASLFGDEEAASDGATRDWGARTQGEHHGAAQADGTAPAGAEGDVTLTSLLSTAISSHNGACPPLLVPEVLPLLLVLCNTDVVHRCFSTPPFDEVLKATIASPVLGELVPFMGLLFAKSEEFRRMVCGVAIHAPTPPVPAAVLLGGGGAGSSSGSNSSASSNGNTSSLSPLLQQLVSALFVHATALECFVLRCRQEKAELMAAAGMSFPGQESISPSGHGLPPTHGSSDAHLSSSSSAQQQRRARSRSSAEEDAGLPPIRCPARAASSASRSRGVSIQEEAARSSAAASDGSMRSPSNELSPSRLTVPGLARARAQSTGDVDRADSDFSVSSSRASPFERMGAPGPGSHAAFAPAHLVLSFSDKASASLLQLLARICFQSLAAPRSVLHVHAPANVTAGGAAQGSGVGHQQSASQRLSQGLARSATFAFSPSSLRDAASPSSAAGGTFSPARFAASPTASPAAPPPPSNMPGWTLLQDLLQCAPLDAVHPAPPSVASFKSFQSAFLDSFCKLLQQNAEKISGLLLGSPQAQLRGSGTEGPKALQAQQQLLAGNFVQCMRAVLQQVQLKNFTVPSSSASEDHLHMVSSSAGAETATVSGGKLLLELLLSLFSTPLFRARLSVPVLPPSFTPSTQGTPALIPSSIHANLLGNDASAAAAAAGPGMAGSSPGATVVALLNLLHTCTCHLYAECLGVDVYNTSQLSMRNYAHGSGFAALSKRNAAANGHAAAATAQPRVVDYATLGWLNEALLANGSLMLERLQHPHQLAILLHLLWSEVLLREDAPAGAAGSGAGSPSSPQPPSSSYASSQLRSQCMRVLFTLCAFPAQAQACWRLLTGMPSYTAERMFAAEIQAQPHLYQWLAITPAPASTTPQATAAGRGAGGGGGGGGSGGATAPVSAAFLAQRRDAPLLAAQQARSELLRPGFDACARGDASSLTRWLHSLVGDKRRSVALALHHTVGQHFVVSLSLCKADKKKHAAVFAAARARQTELATQMRRTTAHTDAELVASLAAQQEHLKRHISTILWESHAERVRIQQRMDAIWREREGWEEEEEADEAATQELP